MSGRFPEDKKSPRGQSLQPKYTGWKAQCPAQVPTSHRNSADQNRGIARKRGSAGVLSSLTGTSDCRRPVATLSTCSNPSGFSTPQEATHRSSASEKTDLGSSKQCGELRQHAGADEDRASPPEASPCLLPPGGG